MDSKFGKVAICISGQLRTGIKAKICFDNFFNGLDADIFYHSWDLDQYIIDNVNDLYKPKRFLVEDSFPSGSMGSFGSMLYSITQANELKKQYEIDNNFRYDLVIKTRFDLVFPVGTRFYDVNKIDPRTIYCSGGSNGFTQTDCEHHSINDVIFWGDSQSMDIATNVFLYYKNKALPGLQELITGYKFDPVDIFYSPGTLIYSRGVRRNLAFVKFAYNLGEIPWREDVSDLDPIADYGLIRERYCRL